MRKAYTHALCAFTLLFSANVFGQNATYSESNAHYTTPENLSSEIYKTNVNKVVFSKSFIDANGSSSQLNNEFTVGDKIHGCIFLETCIPNYRVFYWSKPSTALNDDAEEKPGLYPQEGPASEFELVAYIDDKEEFEKGYPGYSKSKNRFWVGQAYLGDDEMKKRLHFNFVLNYNSKDEAESKEFVDALNALSNGVHKIYFNVFASSHSHKPKRPVATGEITINKTATSKAKLGGSWNDVVAKMNDVDIETRALKALKENAAAQGWKENFTLIKITSEDWDILRNAETSVIVCRQIICTAYAKWPDGHCTYQSFAFIQSYDGGGYQKSLKYYGVVSSSQNNIDCIE